MLKKKNRLNNMMMENMRKSPIYQTLVTDLALEGVLTREKAESILGYEIPDYLKSPLGNSFKEKKLCDNLDWLTQGHKANTAEKKVQAVKVSEEEKLEKR